MKKNLKEKTAHALTWTFIDRFGQQLLQFVLSLILARFFLSPDDYGLMGMLAIFIVLGNILMDCGFPNALIRKKEVTPQDLSTMFYLNLLAGVGLYLLLFLTAPLIAGFYEQPRLVALTRVAGLSFLLLAFGFTQFVNLTRALNFKAITKINLMALFCSAAVSLAAAIGGLGVWTLVLQSVSFMLVRNSCFWFYSPWRPLWLFDKKVIKELWPFSSKVLFTGVLNAVFNNLYALLIGKFYQLRDVGYYAQADKFTMLSASSLGGALQAATYPVLSQIGDDTERLQRAIRKTMRVTAFVAFPAMFALSAVSPSLVQVLLGDKWMAIVPYIQKLSIAWAFIILMNLHVNIFYVRGLAGISLKVELLKKGLILLAAVCTIHLSLPVLITGLMAAHLLGFLISALFIGRRAAYPFAAQIKDIIPYLCIAAVMAVGMYSISLVTGQAGLLLLLQVVAGLVFYIGTTYLLGSKILQEMLELIKQKSHR